MQPNVFYVVYVITCYLRVVISTCVAANSTSTLVDVSVATLAFFTLGTTHSFVFICLYSDGQWNLLRSTNSLKTPNNHQSFCLDFLLQKNKNKKKNKKLEYNNTYMNIYLPICRII